MTKTSKIAKELAVAVALIAVFAGLFWLQLLHHHSIFWIVVTYFTAWAIGFYMREMFVRLWQVVRA